MSILSGTISEAGSSFEAQACQAVLYIGAYFGVVLLVPILLLAAMLQFVVLRLFSRRGPAELS